MRRRSLRSRLVLGATGSLLIAMAVFGVTAALVTRHELRATLDRALRSRAADVERLAVSAPAVLTSPGALEAPAGGRQVAVEVRDARGRILARSVALGIRLLPTDALVARARRDGRPGFETVDLGPQRLRLYVAPIADAGGPAAGGIVLVASDIKDIETTTHRLVVLLGIYGAITAMLASLLALVLTRRGLRPLRRLSEAASGIERTADASRRLVATGADDEIAELTATLNLMLAALEDARERERRFLADASHELRTPVTALLGNVEYAARHGAGREVIGDLRTDATRLARLVDDLLVLERARTGAAPAQLISLAEVAQEAAGDGVQVSARDDVFVMGDRAALLRAIRNLVENARVHGPEGGAIAVGVGAEDGTAYVRVSDAGAGPPAESTGRIFNRFWRGPDAGRRPGSGLGLAIVASVAARHGGTVSVVGSTFTIALPAVADGQSAARS